MLRKNRNIGRGGRCAYGCCHDGLSAKQERRIQRRRENRKWRSYSE